MTTASRFWPAVPEQIWDSIRDEFTLPTAADLQSHFQSLGNPEAMQRAVMVFVGEETLCPGFQLKDGLFRESVLQLFEHAMSLKIPHNVFAAWMVSPLSALAGARPVDVAGNVDPLRDALADFANRYRPVEKRR